MSHARARQVTEKQAGVSRALSEGLIGRSGQHGKRTSGHKPGRGGLIYNRSPI